MLFHTAQSRCTDWWPGWNGKRRWICVQVKIFFFFLLLTLLICFHCCHQFLTDYYAPAPRVGALSSDAHLSVWRLSVTYIGPKSRIERSRKTKIDTGVAHITRDSDTTIKVKGQLAWARTYCGGLLHSLFVTSLLLASVIVSILVNYQHFASGNDSLYKQKINKLFTWLQHIIRYHLNQMICWSGIA